MTISEIFEILLQKYFNLRSHCGTLGEIMQMKWSFAIKMISIRFCWKTPDIKQVESKTFRKKEMRTWANWIWKNNAAAK